MSNAPDELIAYRLKRANESINEVEDLIKLRYYHTAINRIYYACFYAINALLIKFNIKAQTHAGVRQMFGLHCIQTGLISRELGKYYSILFDKRHSGDYDDFIDMNKDVVIDLIEPAKQLISEIQSLIYKSNTTPPL